jgi:dihydrodipicolinate synthase/N-acetylneuraminate lyase
MSLIKGIYAASMSVLNDNLTLNIAKTIKHAENLIEEGCHGVGNIWEHLASTTNISVRKN